jgi:iron(III) transport system substrate-binding protein
VRPALLVQRGLVAAYASPAAADIPAPFKAASGDWTGIAARARILLVNRSQVAPDARPRSLRDLADPRWRGRTAIANPVFGTTTMHVAALFSAWGDDRARAFLAALKANDVRVAASNGDVKRLVASGAVAFGLTDTDDAHEALAEGAPVEVVYPDQDGEGTLIMPTAVVLMKGPHPAAGRRLVDALLAPAVEQALAASSAHMPLRAGVPTPPGVRPVGELKAFPVDPATIGATMERIQPLLREWAGM